MNNTPKTVEDFRKLLALYGDICAQHQSTLHFGRFTVDERNKAIRKSIDELGLITALNELRKADMAYVIGEDETYEGHQMVWSIEHRNTLRAEARLRAEERLQK